MGAQNFSKIVDDAREHFVRNGTFVGDLGIVDRGQGFGFRAFAKKFFNERRGRLIPLALVMMTMR